MKLAFVGTGLLAATVALGGCYKEPDHAGNAPNKPEASAAPPPASPSLSIRGLSIGESKDELDASLSHNGWFAADGDIVSGAPGCKNDQVDGANCRRIGKVEYRDGKVSAFELEREAFTPDVLTVEQFSDKIVNSYAVPQLVDSPSAYESAGAGVQYDHHYSGVATSGETVEIFGNSWLKNPRVRVSGGARSAENFN